MERGGLYRELAQRRKGLGEGARWSLLMVMLALCSLVA